MPMIIIGAGGPLNVEAWKALETWGERWLQNISSRVSGTVGQPHATIKGAAHYLQDEKGKN